MIRRIFLTLLMIVALANASRPLRASDSDVDLDDHVLTITTDATHDIIVVRPNPDDVTEIQVLILQFDLPVNLFDFASEEEIIVAADDFRDEFYDAEQVDSIRVESREGNDWLLISPGLSQPCVLVGGDGNDFINSGSGNDVIWGDDENQFSGVSGGADEIYGNDGTDIIYGGPFNDRLYGGEMNDYLFGDDGEDRLYGNSGVDYLLGGNQNDTLRGGTENDYLYGESGDDDLDGDDGDDTMFGGADNDLMLGGTGNDILFGQGGNDELYGEDGQDELYGGDDNDYLDGSFDGELDILAGGAGVDVFVNRYYEIRTYTYYSYPLYSNPDLSSSLLSRVTSTRQVRLVPYTGTYQYNFELELVQDFSNADGDSYSPVEVD